MGGWRAFGEVSGGGGGVIFFDVDSESSTAVWAFSDGSDSESDLKSPIFKHLYKPC